MPPPSRSRLLLLPLVLGVLVAPTFLTTSRARQADQAMHVWTACKNVDLPARKLETLPVRKLETPRAPNCVNCRAPLLNAPLARADHPAPATHGIDAPPAA